jgi:hypothetical protein
MLPELLKFGGSLAAVALLVFAGWKMGLGGDVRLRSEDEARALADAALCGFTATAVGLDRAGIGALLGDSQGRVMLIRRHGARFAARLLDSHAHVRLDRNFLTIGTGEATFGRVTLDLGNEAQVWAGRMRHLGG